MKTLPCDYYEIKLKFRSHFCYICLYTTRGEVTLYKHNHMD